MARTVLRLSLLLPLLGAQGCAQSSGADGLDVQQRRGLEAVSSQARPSARPGREAQSNVDLPRFPSISPDGKEIVFSWRGDLWKVASTGGEAIRLTSHPGDDLQSAWSRDGTLITYVSNRTGYLNIHLMNADGTGVRQVTDTDRDCILSGFGTDGKGNEVITFAGYLEGDVYPSPRPYMVSLEGGPIVRIHDAFGSTPVISPDGGRVAFVRGGASWHRRHYRGADSRDVWTYHRADESFTRLTDWAGNDGQPRWVGADTLLFLSDREMNCVNLYQMDVAKGARSAERLTAFSENDVKYFDVSADGTTVVLVVWDSLYTLALDEANAALVSLVVRANEDEGDNFQLKAIDHEVDEAALSPDGKVMAFVAYGEVYIRNLEEKSPTRRVTDSHAREKQIAWSPDGLKLYFVSDRDGTDSIYAATVTLTREEVKEDFDQAMNPPEKEEEERQEGNEATRQEGNEATGKEATGQRKAASQSRDRKGAVKQSRDRKGAANQNRDSHGAANKGNEATRQRGSKATRQQGNDVGRVTPDEGGNVGRSPTYGPSRPLRRRRLASSGVKDEGAANQNRDSYGAANRGNKATKQQGNEVAQPQSNEENESSQKADKNDQKDDEKELPKELDPKRWHDAIRFDLAPVVLAETNDHLPRPAPDGKSLAFKRGRGDLMILDVESGDTRLLSPGWDTGLHWRWSPDSRHLAYAQANLNYNTDIWIVPADGSEPAVNVTRHPDNDVNPRWSADGKILSFISERVDEEFDLWMVYLDKNLEVLTPKELQKYYKDAADAAKKRKPLKIDQPESEGDGDTDEEADGKEDDKGAEESADETEDDKDADEKSKEEDEDEAPPEPQKLDLEDAYLRLRRVTTLSDSEGDNAITPGGDRYIFTATIGERGLFSVKWDGTDRKRLSGAVDVQHVSLSGDKIIFVSNGRAGTVPPGGGELKYVDISDKIRIDLEQQASQKFLEAARVLGEVFYHPTMKGLDWPALTEKYHALARKTRTAGEFNHVANRFVGELNASHMGVYARAPSSPNAQAQGRLGTIHRRTEDGYEITAVIPESPAAKGKMALEVGDVITAIGNEPFGPTDTVESRLAGRVDRETLLTIRRVMESGEARDLAVLITPISWREECRLRYRAWRRENAKLTEDWSDGRIGYIHIESMDQRSLDIFERDLYAAAGDKDGLIIDVRSNGGGWTTDRLLASIMAPYHAYTLPRGADREHTQGYPQDRLFIQRYTLPINMLCNEKAYSNAEIISHAFKTLQRGTLVGQETYGAVISTGGMRLIDGTVVRLPLRGWFLPDGTDMENHGAVPDIIVPQTPEAESRDDDEQLRAAVEDLRKRLD